VEAAGVIVHGGKPPSKASHGGEFIHGNSLETKAVVGNVEIPPENRTGKAIPCLCHQSLEGWATLAIRIGKALNRHPQVFL
jgi:hypothetical protein